MTDKKAYPLRISASVLEAVQRWAEDDLRSVNAQIEFVLREALRRQGRLKHALPPATSDDDEAGGAKGATNDDDEGTMT